MKISVRVLLLCIICFANATYAQRNESKKPNIIYILVDDLGWAELGTYGNKFNETPNLDTLATNGLRFTKAYSPAPVCSPTRAALMTGFHPVKVGITNFLDAKDEKFLSPNYLTLNEQLAKGGYHTGLIGKWHLTGDYDKKLGSPDKHGWNEIICSETRYIAGGAYFYPYFFMPELQAKTKGEYLTDRLNSEATDFIQRNADKPFFLYLSHYSVHTKLSAKEEKVKKYLSKPGAGTKQNNPELAAMLESIDDGVGQIVQTLKTLGLEKNTLIIFTSDNGGETNVTTNAPLHGGKSQLYEGGIRVPLIAYWPGIIKQHVNDQFSVNTLDVFPTLSDVAGVKLTDAKKYDGVSLYPLFKGKSTLPARNLYWHYPLEKPHFLGGESSGAILSGKYKLIDFYNGNRIELYDLEKDGSEQNNLAASRPEKVQELKKALDTWRAASNIDIKKKQ